GERLRAELLEGARQVRRELGGTEPIPDDPDLLLADLFDSMGMVEFLLVLAEDLGVPLPTLEVCVGGKFGTVAELAEALRRHGLEPTPAPVPASHAQPISVT